MPARNMAGPLSLPANPSTGAFVMMSPFSGPKGSPLDKDQTGNASTGALNTGIGFGANHVIDATAPASIKAAGFNDDYTPGITMPNNSTQATLAILTAIGGGKNAITGGGSTGLGISAPAPWLAQPLLGFGNGASRDAGAGPAFTGFGTKMVTAAGTVANGGVIETGFQNRSGGSMATGQSAFGSSTTASPAVT
jgi:hypothetical protein